MERREDMDVYVTTEHRRNSKKPTFKMVAKNIMISGLALATMVTSMVSLQASPVMASEIDALSGAAPTIEQSYNRSENVIKEVLSVVKDMEDQIKAGEMTQEYVDELGEELSILNMELVGKEKTTDREIVSIQERTAEIVKAIKGMKGITTVELEGQLAILTSKVRTDVDMVTGAAPRRREKAPTRGGGVVAPQYKAGNFKDVKKDAWYYEAVTSLVKRGGVAGYQDGTFKPNGTITRAEFLKMAYSSATEQEYKAEKGHHWASGVHKAAMEKGIIDNTFPATSDYLNKPITREEMTTIIVNISEIIKGEPKVDTSKTASKIADLGKVSPERKADVLQAYQKGLLAGKGNGFEPQGKTTRGEAAMVIMRILDNDFRVDPDKVVEAPAGRVIKWNDPNKPLDPKVGDVFIDKNGVKHVLKEGYGVLGGGQKIDYHDGTVINGIQFKDVNEGGIGMVDTITGRDLDGQSYWVANGEAHFSSEWNRMGAAITQEFKDDLKAKGIDVTTLEQGKLYHNNWIIIEGGAVNFTGYQKGFNPNNYQQGKY